jgi:hypothetical protein
MAKEALVKVIAIVAGIALITLVGVPASADEATLRKAFRSFMRSAEDLRIEAIPDLYDGGYARISAWGRRVHLNQGLRVDEASIKLVGVSLDPDALRDGVIKVLEMRESSFQARVLLESVQEYFNNANLIENLRLWVEDGYLLGTGKVMFQGNPTKFRMKGFFAVSGTTEVYFYFDTLHANGWPMPTRLIRQIERQINPVVHQRDWPVNFKIRSVRLDAQSLTVSSQGDGTCPTCGGGDQPAISP